MQTLHKWTNQITIWSKNTPNSLEVEENDLAQTVEEHQRKQTRISENH